MQVSTIKNITAENELGLYNLIKYAEALDMTQEEILTKFVKFLSKIEEDRVMELTQQGTMSIEFLKDLMQNADMELLSLIEMSIIDGAFTKNIEETC